MTRDKAIEACARALLKREGMNEDLWQNSYPNKLDFAKDIVTCLEALGVFRPSE
jgi:hypothetical protein